MMRRAAGLFLLCAGALSARAGAQAPQSGSAVPLQIGVRVLPETVTVGEPFDLLIRVRGPLGTTVNFPIGPDSGGAIELHDPAVMRPSDDSVGVDRTARYRLVAWDVGTQVIRIAGPRAATQARATPRLLPLAFPTVFVRSVLPADTALREPKPARDLFDHGPPWWWPWLPILIAAALAAAWFWWWWQRRKRRPVAVPDPFEVAEREFARVEALGLVEAGERGRHVALMVEVLRDYLAARLPVAQPSLTSTELLIALDGVKPVPTSELSGLLAETDLVKFARRPLTAERAKALGREARDIVRAIARPGTPVPLAEAA